MLMMAPANLASACGHRAHGCPGPAAVRERRPITPPSVSPAMRAASISATIAALEAGSMQRPIGVHGEAIRWPRQDSCRDGDAADSNDVAQILRGRLVRPPGQLADVPAQPSPARLPAQDSRASSCPYFCIPAPGQHARAAAWSAVRCGPVARSPSGTGSGDMTVSTWAIRVHDRYRDGPWSVPCLTPPVISTSSCSNFIRAPRP